MGSHMPQINPLSPMEEDESDAFTTHAPAFELVSIQPRVRVNVSSDANFENVEVEAMLESMQGGEIIHLSSENSQVLCDLKQVDNERNIKSGECQFTNLGPFEAGVSGAYAVTFRSFGIDARQIQPLAIHNQKV